MSSYCETAPGHPVHGPYHDTEYGFPAQDESVLFERFVLEINQAGLSWLTILNKRARFRVAYDDFDVATVAAYGESDLARLLGDAGIIRNRLKVTAAVHNAGALLTLRETHGGFHPWLVAHHPLSLPQWVRLFKATFRFTGGEIVNELLMSTGWLPGAHEESCPVHAELLALQPPWLTLT